MVSAWRWWWSNAEITSICTVERLALPPDPCKASASFACPATLGTLGEKHSAKRCESPSWEVGLERGELLTQRQWQAFLPQRNRRWGVQALRQSLWRHCRLRIALLEAVTEPTSGHRRVVQPCGGHQGKKIHPGALAAGPLEQVALRSQGCSVRRTQGGTFLFDFPHKLCRFTGLGHEGSPSR